MQNIDFLKQALSISVNVAPIVKEFAPEWAELQTIARITSVVDINGTKKSASQQYGGLPLAS